MSNIANDGVWGDKVMKTQTMVKPIEILMVESSSADALYYEKILGQDSENKFDFTYADSLTETIEQLEEREYDVILLDPSLPESIGFETFITVRMYAPLLPMIMLLNARDEELAVKMLQNGAQDCLVKGQMDSSVLSRSIRYAIERHRIMAELEQAREKEHHLAYFDVLTGLPNRQLFYDRLDQALAHANRYQEKVALMFIDLDGFKRVNDSMGHHVGDRLLKSAAKRLKDCLRNSDTVARLGGDEFTCILPNIEKTKDIIVVAQKINRALAKPFRVRGCKVSISGSIGISIFPDDTGDLDELIKHADMAMYHAKKMDRNNFQFYNSRLNIALTGNILLDKNLHEILDSKEVLLYEGMEGVMPMEKKRLFP